MSRVLVLGAGVSGLALAHALRGSGAAVTVLEAADRIGGWIDSPRLDGLLLERGPRGFRPTGNGAAVLRLVEELNLHDELLLPSTNSKRRYIWHDGRLQALPTSLPAVLSSQLLRPLLKALPVEPWQLRSSEADESVHSFFSRRFSPAVADSLASAMCAGIYAADARELSIAATFSMLRDAEQAHGSLFRAATAHWAGKWKAARSAADEPSEEQSASHLSEAHRRARTLSFRNGMSTLTEALHARVEEDDDTQLLLRCAASQLARDEDSGCWTAVTADGRQFVAEHIVSTLPAYALAPLVKDSAPDLAAQLQRVSYSSLSVVSAGWKRSGLLPHEGFGFLVPFTEQLPLLGCTWDSSAFPNQSQPGKQEGEETRVTVMMPPAGDERDSDEQLMKERAFALLQDCLGVTASADVVDSYFAEHAIPLPRPGHLQLRKQLQAAAPPGLLQLTTYMHGVGIADCCDAAESMGATLASKL